MAKLRRQTRASKAAADDSSSSSEADIPNEVVSSRTAPPSATLRAKRKADTDSTQPAAKRVRMHRLETTASRAGPSSDAEDMVVNPIVLGTMNTGLFTGSIFANSSRPVRQHPNGLPTLLPQFNGNPHQAGSTRHLASTRTRPRSRLDAIAESPQPRDPDRAISSVERGETGGYDDLEGEDERLFVSSEAGRGLFGSQEDEDWELKDPREPVRTVPNRPRPNPTSGAPSARGGPIINTTIPSRLGVPDIDDENFGYSSRLMGTVQRRPLSPTQASPSRSLSSDVLPIFTATVPTRHVKAVYKLMGRAGWTNKKEWARGLGQDDPWITPIGKKLFKYLSAFRSLIHKAPKAVSTERHYLDEQNHWLRDSRDTLEKYVSEITKLVKMVRDVELRLPNNNHALGTGSLERRRAIIGELRGQIIPQLIRILRSFFSLSGVDPDDGNELMEDVTITPDILAYIRTVVEWTHSLRSKLIWELGERPLENRHVTGAQLNKLVKQQMSSWNLFSAAMDELDQILDDAEEEHEKAKQEEHEGERLAECSQRDEIIQEAREREEEEELAIKQRQYEAVARSVQWIASQPRPLAEKWVKAEPHTQSVRHSSSTPLSGPAMSGGRAPPTPQFPEPPVILDHKPWHIDDKQWLLHQIKRKDSWGQYVRPTPDDFRTFEESLDRYPMSEIEKEAAAFRWSGRCMAWEKGLPVEDWAMEDP